MTKSDRRLGMHRDITRRDFIHGLGLAGLGLGLPASGLGKAISGDPATGGRYYPPTRTGLRGSHPGSFENAHALALGGRAFDAGRATGEEYDLVIVGGGISGLAAARFYQQRFGDDARILILENHDDFGGHAKRNEFHQGGVMRLSLGGTHNLEYWSFSDTVKDFMAGLGVQPERLLEGKEFGYGRNGRNGPAIWFDAETYGENRLVTGCSLYDTKSLDARVGELPISAEAREQLKRFLALRINVVEGKSEAEAQAWLASISYPDFLRQYGGLGEEALQLFAQAEHGSYGVDFRVMSAREFMQEGFPGHNLVGLEPLVNDRNYHPAMYPDGNASIARLQVRQLIPKVAPEANAENIAVARFDYDQLDRPDASVRLRLNSTVVRVRDGAQDVAVTYVNDVEALQVRARHCVLACWHNIIPHLCPEMSAAQKRALNYQVKMPLLLTNVLIRSSRPLDRLGIQGAYCPGRMHAFMFLFKGINTGGYEHRMADDGPVPLVLWGTIAPPAGAVTAHDQFRASSAKMLALRFEDYEREVRTVLDGMLGPAGFGVKNDILAITINRWPHGYAYNYFDLWDPDYEPGQAPHEVARRPFGNIAIANADAGADAYTHVAIDQAWRAVNELPDAA